VNGWTVLASLIGIVLGWALVGWAFMAFAEWVRERSER
jgi:hypothetical protein